MIRHCVFLHFPDTVGRAERDLIYVDLHHLCGVLPGVLAFCSGLNVSPEGLGKGFDEGFTIDFTDAAARDAYLIDARHRAIGARIVAAAESGPAGVLVFDLAV